MMVNFLSVIGQNFLAAAMGTGYVSIYIIFFKKFNNYIYIFIIGLKYFIFILVNVFLNPQKKIILLVMLELLLL